MAKHYIYHIIGKKVGCTKDIPTRMKRQGVKEGEYEILEEHTNAKVASVREIELQKQYNYKVDHIPYYKVLQNQKGKNGLTRKDIARKVDWAAARAKVENWSEIFKEKRTPKIDYDAIFEKRDEKAIQEKRIPQIEKPVAQYDKQGNLIAIWESGIKAAEFLNKPGRDDIGACARGKQKTAFGYIWRFL